VTLNDLEAYKNGFMTHTRHVSLRLTSKLSIMSRVFMPRRLLIAAGGILLPVCPWEREWVRACVHDRILILHYVTEFDCFGGQLLRHSGWR